MKKILITLTGLSVLMAGIRSCEPTPVEAGFEDMIDMTILDYVQENPEEFSLFLKILEAGGIDKTVGAYNPDNLEYTLFLPTNQAVERFIQESKTYSSLEDLIADDAYVSTLSRYHVVNSGISTDDFPFGALPERTLSEDILTVSFVTEPDTSYFKINNLSPVIKPNIETSNGYVHVISVALNPVTYTTYDWLVDHPGYSIFKSAVDVTGLQFLFNLDSKDEESAEKPFTLFLEHDSVFQRCGMNTLDDLALLISPGQNDYTSETNPLNNFITYHALSDIWFLDDFADVSTNYSTHSNIPLNIDGIGLDILINKGKQVFDTIINGPDTTIVDYVGFYYDQSNIITRSGAIHMIDQILRQVNPSRQIQTFQFLEEPLFRELGEEPGEYLIEDPSALQYITWTGPDLFYVKEASENHPAWSQDYLFLDGDFSISYLSPKIVQGTYTVLFGAEAYSSENALVEVFIDGKKFGGLVDLSTGGSPGNPFAQIELGDITFMEYTEHIIEVRSLIPGELNWDYIRFEPN
ncbi:MAG: fasciclin domain-containing protein [Bacteroidales bacterium]|nr:fasciclin domain-containing protein [Bacteroidales bacterium]